MLLSPTLTTAAPDPALDQQQLYALGLDHVRRLSRRLWTDHNAHDPGITTLELLCYALTDLSYRARFPVEDLLATRSLNAETMADQFFTPRQILPNAPLTLRDYRKLLIDLDDVRNAWVYPVSQRLYADTVAGKLMHADSGEPGVRPVDIKGLYGVLLDYHDNIKSDADREEVRRRAETRLQQHRNLCERFVEIRDIEHQPYTLCAEIELEMEASAVEVAAQIRHQVARYLTPVVRAYPLSQMLARRHPDGTPYTTAEIFEGPALMHGFIDSAELDAADLRREILLSDIISIIMDIPGVRAVRDIIVNVLLLLDPETNEWVAVEAADKWRVPVPEGKQPVLSREHGRLVFYKRNVPTPADATLVQSRMHDLALAEQKSIEDLGVEDVEIPLGRPRDTGRYHSFQHHFPALYGLSEHGHPSPDPLRQAEVLQLKAYLLFFDQIMANYFAQLANLRKLYSRSFAEAYADDPANARTFFSQKVTSIPQYEHVYAATATAAELDGHLEDNAQALERRNRILDHLLARFAEEFHHYANLMRAGFGASAASTALTKCRMLDALPRVGAERGLAYNYSLKTIPARWNSDNISGLERRIAHLLGIGDMRRRNLSSVSYATYTELDKTPGDEYRFRIKHPVSGKIVLSSKRNYLTPEIAREVMLKAIDRAQMPNEGYQRKQAVDGTYYFNVVDEANKIIARRIEFFETEAAMEAAIDELITYLRDYYSGEGMYLIENILLLPEQAGDPFMPICADPNCNDCSDDDPYSYRLHFVLPAFAGRFKDMEFRRFAEETIRQETPAHILPKICWINTEDMAKLEAAYRQWIDLRCGAAHSNRTAKLETLIDALFRIKSIYPTRLLHDCSTDEEKPPFILGSTSLGSQNVKS